MSSIRCPHCRAEFHLTQVLSSLAEHGHEKLVVGFSCECSSWDGYVLRTNVHDAGKATDRTIELPEPSVIRNVRSDIAASIQKYWVGHPASNIGMQYLRYKDGVIEALAGMFERRDLLLVQFWDICNAFVEPDGSIQIDPWSGNVLTEADRVEIKRIVDGIAAKHADYFARENRFFQEKPWLQVHGMTPENAVKKLTELGWGPTPTEPGEDNARKTNS